MQNIRTPFEHSSGILHPLLLFSQSHALSVYYPMRNKEVETFILEQVYTYRVQSVQTLLKKMITRGIPKEKLFEEYLLPMIEEGLLEYHSHPTRVFYVTPTKKTMDAMLEANGLERYYVDSSGKTQRTYKTASMLRIKDKLVDHELELVDFLWDLERCLDRFGLHPETFIEEPLDARTDYLRPDALVWLSQDHVLFIEQDMGTESRKQLREKWRRYRRYLNTQHGKENRVKITILFRISCEESSLPVRKQYVYDTLDIIHEYFLDGFFDIYVGSARELLEALTSRILLDESSRLRRVLGECSETLADSSYKLVPGYKLSSILAGVVFDFVLFRQVNGVIPISNGVIDLTVFEVCSGCPSVSTFVKRSYLRKVCGSFPGGVEVEEMGYVEV